MSRNVTPSIVFGNLTGQGPLSNLDTVYNQLFGVVTDSSNGFVNYGVDTGTVNNYVLTLTPPPASYQAGFTLAFVPLANNTGASVINVNALGSKSIVDGLTGAALLGGELAGVTTLVYDGTQFRLASSGQDTVSGARHQTTISPVLVNQTYNCAGANTVTVNIIFASAIVGNIGLTNLTPGVPVFIGINNTSAGTATLGFAGSTQANGTGYSTVSMIQVGAVGFQSGIALATGKIGFGTVVGFAPSNLLGSFVTA